MPLELAHASQGARGASRSEPNTAFREEPVETPFLHEVLKPYVAKGCVYLKSSTNLFCADQCSHATRASFSIADSCYIDSTGHFNAVELNICCNQMYYVLWADIVRRREVPEAAHWGEADFAARQLPGMLIVRLSSEFKKPIDAMEFRAEGRIERIRMMGKPGNRSIFIRTHGTFTDDKGGLARCDVDFAVFR